jgi:hypothetical protein
MTVVEAAAALDQPLALPAGDDGSDDCHYVGIPGLRDVSFMVQAGRITRVDIDSRAWATPSGVRVGDSEEEVFQTYGKRLEVRRHFYVSDGHYLLIRASDRRHALLLETVENKVLRIRGGAAASVDYVEGCQ